MDKDILQRVGAMLNAFETGSAAVDYDDVYIYRDGPNDKRQVTLGRGFTSMGGNLWKVIKRYMDKGGELSSFFAPYKSKMSLESLCNDKPFINNLIKASKTEQVMRDAQDEIFEEEYLSPALNFFTKNGFKDNLSFAVIADSYLHSGSILDFLRKRFNAKVPSSGGKEKVWIEQYINTRHEWLKKHSDKILRGTVYRTQFFKNQIKAGNWDFNLPLNPNGISLKD